MIHKTENVDNTHERSAAAPKTAFLLYFPLAIIYLEVILRLAMTGKFFESGLFYILMFSLAAGIILSLLTTFFSPKINRLVAGVFLTAITLVYSIQLVYHRIFGTFLILYSVNVGSRILQFWDVMLDAVSKSAPMIAAFFLPLVLFFIFGKKHIIFRKTTFTEKFILVCFAAFIQLLTTVIILSSDVGALSPKFLYTEAFIPDASVSKFGLIATEGLDIKYMLLGASGNLDNFREDGENKEDGSKPGPAQKEAYEDQVMDIDFGALMASESDKELSAMHSYFSQRTPTRKNEYTGMFEGKNLIFITAESLSPYAIDKDLTPVLYMMREQGFKFNNFYTPSWGVSTSDGEYVACTGLIPKSGVWSFSKSRDNALPFCMGNQFKKQGIATYAYHNNTYTYYNRHLSHPNMGYIYKGLGNGLNVRRTWPESDIEMMEASLPDYIGSEKFHVYYMTVSGHLLYSFSGNYIATKNRDLVSHLNYSDSVKAYLASNIELDLAMEYLLQKLNEAGVADDTVIVISPDHYPYGLKNEEIEELAGHKIDTEFELYRGVLLIYSQGMEKPVTVEKLASSLDIIPTVSNLFGLEYDSRLLMGRDIMSDSPPLVIFSNRSFITDRGKFNSKTGEFEPFERQTADDEYLKRISADVNNKFKISQKILDRDYYRVLFKNP